VSFKRKYIFFKLARLFKTKIIYHFHGNLLLVAYPGLGDFWKRCFITLYKQADVVICLSESAKHGILSIAPQANIVVLQNSVVVPVLSRNEESKDKRRTVQLTFLGHIKQEKGVYDLLEVVKRMFDYGTDIHLSIGGMGEIERLQNEVARLSLEGKVTFLGWISEETRDRLLRNTDIFILPSYSEAMPMSILEAMSYGVPVISTCVGGIPELVIEGETGFLVKPGDLENLYNRIADLIQDKEKRIQFGNKGRQVIKEKHNLDINVKTIESLYEVI
jgi:glycosyltransferase involved in cell wall biosynthesis